MSEQKIIKVGKIVGADAETFKNTVKSNMAPVFDLSDEKVISTISPDDKIVKSNVLDTHKGEYVTFKEVDLHFDGTPMDDTKVDGYVYKKLEDKYFKQSGLRYLSPDRYGVVGNGGDDTEAIQKAFDAIEDGMDFILPYGEYNVTTVTISGKKNVNFYFVGTIKAKDGSDVTRVLSLTGNENCNFYNLKIDGNRDNVVDKGVVGSQPNLEIGHTQKRLNFYNLRLINSAYSGCIFNGKCEDVNFYNTYLENIGEHGFYISGGENKRLSFYGLYVKNINRITKVDHGGLVFKIRKTSFEGNEYFYFENIEFEQTLAGGNDGGEFMFNLSDIKNMTARNIKHLRGASTKTAVCVINGPTENILFDNIEAHTLIYNVSSGPVKNITLKRGRFLVPSFFNFVNCIDLLEDVEISGRLSSSDLTGKKDSSFKTIFQNCKFTNNTLNYRHNLESLNSDIIFEKCEFKGSSGSSVSNNLINLGGDSYTSGVTVSFIKSKINATGWSNSIGVYSPVNLEIINGSHINVRARSYSIKIPTVKILDSILPATEFINKAYYDNIIIDNNTTELGGLVYRTSGITAERPNTPPKIGFSYYNTEIGGNEKWDGSGWVSSPKATQDQTNIGTDDSAYVTPKKLKDWDGYVPAKGLSLTLGDGVNLSGVLLRDSLVKSVITPDGVIGNPVDNGYPVNYADISTHNGSTKQRTYSILKDRDSNDLYIQSYNLSGVGQGWVLLNPQASASADSAADVSATYDQTEVQDILDELRDLKAKLRSAGLLAT